jgi:hypothetical protein
MANVLRDRWGFTEIQILTDSAATRSAILTEFRDLVAHSRDVPCLFAFSGAGSEDSEHRLSLVAADSRQLPDVYDDIDLAELVKMAQEPSHNLIAIVDAGWTNVDRLPTDQGARSRGRTAPQNQRPRLRGRELVTEERRSLEGLDLKIGRLTVYGPSIELAVSKVYSKPEQRSGAVEEGLISEGLNVEVELPDPEPGTSSRKTRGILSHALIQALWQLEPATATVTDWIGATSRDHDSRPWLVRASKTDESIFGKPSSQLILESLTRIERDPLGGLIARLKHLAGTEDQAETYLNLGLALASVDEYTEAIRALERAKDHEAASAELRAEAHYHLGRAYYEGVDDVDRAISALRFATEQDPAPAGAFYYLGRALRDSAQRDLPELSVAAFRKYLEFGAPLGHRDEVLSWIESVRSGPAAEGLGRISMPVREALS